MHELSIAQSILEIVQHHLPADGSRNVRTVSMKVGELSGVVTDSLEFCFQAITAGTTLEGARLAIEHLPVRARCRTCSAAFPVEQSVFRCTSCGGSDLEIVSGRELQVTEIELADEGAPS
jgi:hydrogenase nickel incorporation protein HypA/HybF